MESLRVYYVERQRLVVADLQSEQDYLAGLDERHNRLNHAPGIVRGLHINVESAGHYVVEPGIAIDSFGRELVLRQPETIVVDDAATKCADVWLVYCRQPLRLRQTGRTPCSSNTFQRWTEIPRVVVVITEKKAGTTGKDNDAVSPVDGAVFLGRLNCEDTRGVDYTTLHGAEVADPGGRALMQVGPRTGWDKTGFMLSITDAAGNMTRRVVLDRRNNNSLYGTMELLEYRASRIVTAFNKAVHLLVEARRAGKTGEGIQIEEKEGMQNGKPTATFTFLNSSRETDLPASEKVTIGDDLAAMIQTLKDFNKISQLVRLRFVALLVSVFKKSVRLMVEAKSAGTALDDIKIEVVEATAGGKPTATLTFTDTSVKVGTPPSEKLTISGDPTLPADLNAMLKQVADFDKISKLVTVKIFEVIGPDTNKQRAPGVRDDRLPALTLGGGTLRLEAWPTKQESTDEDQRGCDDAPARAVLDDGDEPNGLSFLPLAQPPQGPPTPGVYMVSVTSGDLTTDQLRFDLGEKKDADNSVRFSLGAGAGPNQQLDSWLTICGNCLVTLVGGDTSDPQNPPTSVQVTGSIEQSPIKPDTTDPQFNDLLVAAWMAGLQSSVAASTIVDLAIESDLPRFVETGEPLSYTIRLTNKGGVPVPFDKLLANLSTGVINLKKQGTIPANGSITIPVTHETNQPVAGTVTIEILASGKVGNFAWQKSGPRPPASVEVVESPELDLSDLPEVVPPDTSWDHTFRVVNKTSHRLSLTEVKQTEGSVVTPFLPMPQVLEPLQTASFGPVSHPNGVKKNLTVILNVKYKWENGPQGSRERRRTIRVERQLNTQFLVPDTIPFDDDWNYSLVLTNVSAKDLKLTLLEQRLTSAAFTTPFQEIVVPAADSLLTPGQSKTLKKIAGHKVTSATDTVTLEIRARYEVEGRTFEPPHDSTEIDVEDIAG